MESTSMTAHVSSPATQEDSHDYMGHRETGSMTTIATTCVILIVVIGVGVAVLFCKRFVESRNSVPEEDDLCPETRSSPSNYEVRHKSYDPPRYNDVITGDGISAPRNLVQQTHVNIQKFQQEARSEICNTSTNIMPDQNCSLSRNSPRYIYRSPDVIPTSRLKAAPFISKRQVKRSTSETLVYIPYRFSWSEPSSSLRQNDSVDSVLADPKASKSCNDIDTLPSYEDAVKMCQNHSTE